MTDDTQNVYRVMDDLSAAYQAAGQHELANVILHRVHKVAWTSRTELLEELKMILVDALEVGEHEFPPLLQSKTQDALLVVERELK